MTDVSKLMDMAERGEVIAYFGYGSLVNTKTHRTEILGTAKASVHGFRRHWQRRPAPDDSDIALLSVHRSDQSLPGLMVFDHRDNLPAVDERETGYDRVRLDRDEIEADHPLLDHVDSYIYLAQTPLETGVQPYILQSYLDAVLEGYVHMHGPESVDAFVRSTVNFEIPINFDRDAPMYPRSVDLSPDHVSLFDAVLAELKVTR